MEAIARTLSPSSASWVVWVLLSLLCVVVVNRSLLYSIPTLWHSLSSYSERVYTGGRAQTILNRALSVLFRLGVMAMCVYMLCYQSGGFAAVVYCKLLGVVASVSLLQWFAVEVVGYTFLPPAQRENVMEQRRMVYDAACVILLLLLLPMIHTIKPLWHHIFAGVFVAILLGVMIVRGVQMFSQNAVRLLYVLLYIITLELLPLMGIIVWAKHII